MVAVRAKKAARERVVVARVLVVEDDDDLLDCYRRCLERARYEVVAVRTVADANQAIADGPPFDVAVLDYDLPDGTAVELVTALLECSPLCKSLIISCVAGSEIARQLAGLGAHKFCRKTVYPPLLIEEVANAHRASLDWRNALRERSLASPVRAPPTRRTESEREKIPPPVEFDLTGAVARIRHIGGLTDAETLALGRLLWGDTDPELASYLGCTERTAKHHVAAVLLKTYAKRRSGLLRVIMEDNGLKDPSPPKKTKRRGPSEDG